MGGRRSLWGVGVRGVRGGGGRRGIRWGCEGSMVGSGR